MEMHAAAARTLSVDPTDSAGVARSAGRSPAAAVTAAVICGILLDRWLDIPGMFWAAAGLVGLLVSLAVGHPRAAVATAALLVACVAVGGLRHQLTWSTLASDDISLLATKESRPIKLVGIVASPVAVLRADQSTMTPPWMRIDRSLCDLRCEQVLEGAHAAPVSGVIQLHATGHLLHVEVGDRVEVIGQLTTPRGPSNPGAHDFPEYLRRQGIRCLVRCDHPAGVRRLQARVTGRVARWRSHLRSECEAMFVRSLDRRTVPLAVSLLLGERGQLPGDVRRDFVESGTMHLLAISGLHVGILAGLLLLICRWLNLSVVSTTLVVLIGIGLYALVTNLRPPVVRASVLAIVAAAGWPAYRRLGGVNLVSVCALTVLLVNPTDLFDIGTQLSFLAVVAIGWAASAVMRWRPGRTDNVTSAEGNVPRAERLSTFFRWLMDGYVVTTAIWLFTLPLTAAAFHVVAPVGFLVNVLLIPYVAITLTCGFLTILCGLLLPWFAGWPAGAFDLCLGGLLWLVEAASSWRLGHVYVSGPATWWLVVFYVLLSLAVMLRRRRQAAAWSWIGLWSWVILGQIVSLIPVTRDSLRCTILDMGHGCCVMIELPQGQTLLYDAGMMSGDWRGQQVIQAALWSRGVERLNGVLVSHADVDHFNAAAGLMQTMPVGALLFHRSFLDVKQPAVEELCHVAADAGVPQLLVQAGDTLATDQPNLTLGIRHPAVDWASDSDNANSLVLEIRFAGRAILLTGDLEEAGLERLLEQPAGRVDVLLAPHHGSQSANPRALAEWAQPTSVIVSGHQAMRSNHLVSTYSEADRVFQTPADGAVTVEIWPDGRMTVTPFVDGSSG